ncbi:Metacaspase-1 [Diplonema papillatum]|nr:Metacaspase-1 [Diplonema papillatum]
MGSNAVFTHLTLVPNVGVTEQELAVRWQVGRDIKWTPTGNDEIRVFSTAGVLLGSVPMWTCRPCGEKGSYTSAEGRVVAPALPGSYVICLYDFLSKRRIYSSTFRVVGANVSLPIELEVKQVETLPSGRVDVSFNPKDLHGGSIALYRVSDTDNDGANKDNESPFGCSLVTVPSPTADLLEGFDKTSLAFVAPEALGEYHIRYIKTSRASVLRTVAVSNTFEVRGQSCTESLWAQAVQGTLSLPGAPRSGLKVGSLFTVAWDVAEGLSTLSELDCLFLYPYGRPEAVRQTDRLCTAATAALAKWRAELRAPTEAGRYELGLYSHRLQKFVLNGPSVLVVGEHAFVKVVAAGQPLVVGQEQTVEWCIDESVYCPEDRYRVYDEGMNLYGSLPIPAWEERCSAVEEEGFSVEATEAVFCKRVRGTLKLRFDRPGKYIAAYWSRLLGREVARTVMFKVVAPPTGTYPLKNLKVFLTVRQRQSSARPISVIYNTVISSAGGDAGADDGEGVDQQMHAIAVYAAGDNNFVPSPKYCSVHEWPAKRVFWLDNRVEGSVTFEPISEPGLYHVRYLAPTGHNSWSSTVQNEFRIVEPGTEEEQGTATLDEPLDHLPLGELSSTATGLVDDDGEGALPLEDYLKAAEGAEKLQKQAKRQRKQATANGLDLADYVLKLTDATGFRGSIVVPSGAKVENPIFATVHVTGGYPLAGDSIVLVDKYFTEVHSAASLQDAMGRDDFTLSTVCLRPPKTKGLFLLGYYSSKASRLVFHSELFRVSSDTAAPENGERHPHQAAELPDGAPSEPGRDSVRSSVLHSLTRPARFRGLLVGVAYHGAGYPLRGTTNDTILMKECLRRHFGHTDVVTLNEAPVGGPSSKPTAYNIREGFRWLLRDARAGDHLLFYFAGLGSRLNSFRHDEAEGYDCCLLPVDYDWRERVIRFTELKNDLYLAAPLGTSVTVIMDCCFTPNTLDVAVQRGLFDEEEVVGTAVHSAAVRLKEQRKRSGHDDRLNARCLVPPQGTFHTHYKCKERATAGQPDWAVDLGGLASLLFQPDATSNPEPAVRRGMCLVQACRADEMAVEKFSGGRYAGLFTHAFTRAVNDVLHGTTPSNPIWNEAVVEQAQRILAEYPYTQTPRLCVSSREQRYAPLFHIPRDSVEDAT